MSRSTPGSVVIIKSGPEGRGALGKESDRSVTGTIGDLAGTVRSSTPCGHRHSDGFLPLLSIFLPRLTAVPLALSLLAAGCPGPGPGPLSDDSVIG
eukprot:435546-Hanusia_phi.AAC.1